MSFHFDKSVDSFFGEAKERLGDDYLAALERAGISNGTTAFSKLPASKLNSLCNELFVTFESIATGNVDFLTIQNHLQGGSAIPAKYLRDVPFSSRFTSIYMLVEMQDLSGEIHTSRLSALLWMNKDHSKALRVLRSEGFDRRALQTLDADGNYVDQ